MNLNRLDLRTYGLLKKQVMELDERIQEAQDELTELDNYNVNISPVYTGMPNGNEKKDKIADFVIRLEKDRQGLSSTIAELKAERSVIMYKLKRIRTAVDKISDVELKDIVISRYLNGESIIQIAEKNFMTANGIYKKINRFFGSRKPD